MDMLQYQQDASRTSAPPDMALRPDMFSSHSKLAFELVNHVVHGQQADILKRALFYKEPLGRLQERSDAFKDTSVGLYEATKDVETTRVFNENEVHIIHAALGLISEAGEIIEEVIKAYIEKRPVDFVNLGEEGGDSMWYLAELFNAIETDFHKQGEKNISKLRKRFPDKFSQEHALNRDLGAERKVLEA